MKKFIHSLTYATLLASILGFHFAKAEVNFRISPISPFFGVVTANIDFAFAESWTIGPRILYWDTDSYGHDVEALGGGLRVDYYWGREALTTGWYTGFGVDYAQFLLTEENTAFGDLEGDTTGMILTPYVGYQFYWGSFNINAGGGLAYYATPEIELEDANGIIRDEEDAFSGFDFATDFSIGYKF